MSNVLIATNEIRPQSRVITGPQFVALPPAGGPKQKVMHKSRKSRKSGKSRKRR